VDKNLAVHVPSKKDAEATPASIQVLMLVSQLEPYLPNNKQIKIVTYFNFFLINQVLN